jgi:hypothetical protein
LFLLYSIQKTILMVVLCVLINSDSLERLFEFDYKKPLMWQKNFQFNKRLELFDLNTEY